MKYLDTIVENLKESWPFIKENSFVSILSIFLMCFATYFIISKIHLTKINNLKAEKKNLQERLGIDQSNEKDASFEELKFKSACLIYDVTKMIESIENKEQKITYELQEINHKIFLEKVKTGMTPIKANDDAQITKNREKADKIYVMYNDMMCNNFDKTFKSDAINLYKKLLRISPYTSFKIKPYFESYFSIGDKYSIQNILKTIDGLSNNNMIDDIYRPVPNLQDPRLTLNTKTNFINGWFVLKSFYLPFLGLCIVLAFFFFQLKITNIESSINKYKNILNYGPPSENKFINLSKKDIKEMCDDFIQKLYALKLRWKNSEHELDEIEKAQRKLSQVEYLNWSNNEYRNMRMKVYQQYLDEYNKNFKNDALSYQEVLMKHLNKSSSEEIIKNKEAYLLNPRFDTSIKNNINDIYRIPRLPDDLNIIAFDLTSMIEEL